MFHINIHQQSEYISNYIREKGFWEPITTEVLGELFRVAPKNTIFVDVGANIGYFSLLAAFHSFQTISFEPVKENYELFEKSITQNNFQDLITLEKISIGNTTKDNQEIFISKSNLGNCSHKFNQFEIVRTDKVRMETLDNIISKKIPNYLNCPMIVKIDVEEMECEVLEGMKNLLENGTVSHIIIEIVTPLLDKVFEFLKKYDFTHYTSFGFESEEMVWNKINPNSTYLQQEKYITSIDKTPPKSIQYQLLFYKSNNPLKF